ncbi:prepilin-type N-terminal cleavage/methylation domain-containing protein [Mycobacterium sp. KBS0706]|uniref:prepilin-type N-terminal cleavage/methylation domain-containing protein n=1 Tax=Mycobacterium sp. KBS0706 TaxID=2578109 RepID=UPI00110FAAE0|nr:prepilin-type N-terminal cleavage/methylation domain-containing protein [Mycobacterium sp. KBS0706]TSD87831.1 prepilin-type N-terminal cleavage/methylation domain-containing protein [Mycobacterium sp. KBS0706]
MSAPDQRGFTLLETIIAMVVLALVMVLLTGGLRFVTAGWDRGARAAEASETIALVQSTLRREAAAARRLTWQAQPGAKPAATFWGDPDRVGLVVADPGFPSEPGLAIAFFYVDVQPGESTLRYSRARFDPRLDGFADAKATDDLILSRGRVAYRFDYFGTVSGEQRPRWVSPWPDLEAPPQLIRLRSRDAEGLAVWPDIVVPLPVALEAACVRTITATNGPDSQQPAGQNAPSGPQAGQPPRRQQPPPQPQEGTQAAAESPGDATAAPPATGADDFCSLSVQRDAKAG